MQENPPNVAGQWRQVAETSTWSGQDGVGLLNINGTLYMLGGWAPGAIAAPYTHNHVRKSIDGGRTWERLADAPWEARHTAGWLVHDGKLWVIGGDINRGHYQRDVWCGTPTATGIDWVQITANAAPLSMGRTLHQVFSHAGKMWIVGGQTLDDIPSVPVALPSTKPGSPYYADVWSSVNGADWTKVSDNNPWAPRGLILGSAVKDGHMWLIGGGAYETKGNARIYRNDVWKSADGSTWVQVTPDAGFPARQYNSVAILGDEFVLIAGWNGDNIADAWASNKAGTNWRKLPTPPWTARHATSVANYRNELIMLGGPLNENSVWAMN